MDAPLRQAYWKMTFRYKVPAIAIGLAGARIHPVVGEQANAKLQEVESEQQINDHPSKWTGKKSQSHLVTAWKNSVNSRVKYRKVSLETASWHC